MMTMMMTMTMMMIRAMTVRICRFESLGYRPYATLSQELLAGDLFVDLPLIYLNRSYLIVFLLRLST